MQLAKNVALSGQYGVEIAPHQFTSYPYYITVSYPVILPAALVIKIVGPIIWAPRFVAALFIVGLVLSFYFVARYLYGRWMAFASTTLLVSFPPLYGNGRAFLGEVPGLAYLFFCIFLWQAGRNFSRRVYACLFFALSGLSAGMALASKPSFLLVIPGFAIFLFLEYLKREEGSARRLFFWGFGFASSVIAWVLISIPRPYSFKIFKEIFNYYSNSYADADILGNVSANVLKLFTDGSAILFLVLLVGAVVVFCHEIFSKKVFTIAWPLYIFAFLTFLWWLKTPGWYRYFFPAEIVLFMFFPTALRLIVQSIFGKRFFGYFVYGLAIVSLAAFQFWWFIFKSYVPTGSATLIVEILNNKFNSAAEIFVLNSPEFSFGIRNHNFSQYFYYNPTHALGENALLRPAQNLQPIVVNNLKSATVVLPQVQEALDRYYKTYIFEGSNVIKVLNNYDK